jgi:hypothetical protein
MALPYLFPLPSRLRFELWYKDKKLKGNEYRKNVRSYRTFKKLQNFETSDASAMGGVPAHSCRSESLIFSLRSGTAAKTTGRNCSPDYPAFFGCPTDWDSVMN